MLWTVISSFYSVKPILSIKFLLARTWYIIPFVVLPQLLIKSQTDCKKLALLLVLPMLAMVTQALIRFGFYGFAFDSIKKTMDHQTEVLIDEIKKLKKLPLLTEITGEAEKML